MQTGRVPVQIYLNQPILLFPEGLDAIQPQRIITDIALVVGSLRRFQRADQLYGQGIDHLGQSLFS